MESPANNNEIQVLAEYVWLDGNDGMRSKIKIFTSLDATITLASFPLWNFDGSSTGQSHTKSSDLVLRPIYFCINPLTRSGLSREYLVMCEVVGHPTNTYQNLLPIYEATKNQDAWFGIEQEYILLDLQGKLYNDEKFNRYGRDLKSNEYYCSVGTGRAIARPIALEHMRCCLIAGLTIGGINSEVTPAQWEFQIGPLDALTVSHQLWLARYILIQIAEKYDAVVSFHPKPFKFLNGSGAHTNFSTKSMRETGGLAVIKSAIHKLSLRHSDHIEVYGNNNRQRLTGTNETSNYETFSYGNCDRTSSIRIPVNVVADGCGYLEDRRPAANCDPYQVCRMILKTTCLDNFDGGDE